MPRGAWNGDDLDRLIDDDVAVQSVLTRINARMVGASQFHNRQLPVASGRIMQQVGSC